ncbi:NAD(P)-dependent iron-only hydrogenase iron-sulfur protein [Clostridium sp. USBA 49]|uniref:(2Fe-2S) ferredoxin domain-containing protein n=1 Tax=Clostridium sp. USBA 49 TaxID=1881060 RepID=UPI0009999CD3|nr:(2Fe-2S) ferredoxin domain-containing protein [Clostridium sp. USBA 49]SKA90206.1 NAD(P)-dependent iron-only hydrogenase iron-sulfur protein [Clostridium sp. USBA 49]
MKTVEDIKNIKNAEFERVNQGTNRKTTRIVVGMGTCGLAAGAEPVYEAIVDEVNKLGLNNVIVVKTGCIGVCRLEPIVEVIKPGEEKVTYVNMSPYKARRVVASHVLTGTALKDYTIHVVRGKILNDYTIDND